MAKLKIFTFPDTVLAQKAKPVQRVEKTMYKLADDMLETMYDAPGIGLAANQVGILDRIIVVDTEYELKDVVDGEIQAEGGTEIVGGNQIIMNRKPLIMINPEIIHREGKIAIAEGCLSVPEYTGEVDRSQKIKVQYQDVDGLQKTMMAEDLLAICLQHEMDHLEGRLFIDRLSPLKKDSVKKRLLKLRQESEE